VIKKDCYSQTKTLSLLCLWNLSCNCEPENYKLFLISLVYFKLLLGPAHLNDGVPCDSGFVVSRKEIYCYRRLKNPKFLFRTYSTLCQGTECTHAQNSYRFNCYLWYLFTTILRKAHVKVYRRLLMFILRINLFRLEISMYYTFILWTVYVVQYSKRSRFSQGNVEYNFFLYF
jgi:hypothetical protein